MIVTALLCPCQTKTGTDICFDWVDDTAAFQSFSLSCDTSLAFYLSLSYYTNFFFWFGGCFITWVNHHFTATGRRLSAFCFPKPIPFSPSLGYGSAVLVSTVLCIIFTNNPHTFPVAISNLPIHTPLHIHTLPLIRIATVASTAPATVIFPRHGKNLACAHRISY